MSRQVSERKRTAKIHPDDAEQDPPAKRSRFAGLQISLSAQNGLEHVISQRHAKFDIFSRPTCKRNFLAVFLTFQYSLRLLIVSVSKISKTIKSQEALAICVFDISQEIQPPINPTFVSIL
jgi:hypothetical protein